MLNSEQLRAFLDVFDTGSLTQASARAHITQPALGRKIHLLEAELGAPLFERNARGMSPTLQGLKLEAHARPLVLELERLKYQVSEAEIAGPVALAVTPSIGLSWIASMIEGFIELYPSAQLHTSAVLSGDMGQQIASGRFDLGLLYSPHTTPHLLTSELWQERTYFVSGVRRTSRPKHSRVRASIDTAAQHQSIPLNRHPAVVPKSITLAEVLQSKLILPSSEAGIFALLELEARRLGLPLKAALVIDSVQLALELVRSGNYGFVLTERAVADIREKGLRAIPIVRPALKRSAQLVTTQAALNRPVVKALWDYIQTHRRQP